MDYNVFVCSDDAKDDDDDFTGCDVDDEQIKKIGKKTLLIWKKFKGAEVLQRKEMGGLFKLKG